jgi:hypothetical protein
MKKILFVVLLITGFGTTIQAQKIAENALGLRLGDNDGLGAEISYQRALSNNNRLEADLGWRSNNNVSAIKLTGVYQWVWNIDGDFNWYAGVGGGLGNWSTKYNTEKSSGTFLFAAGAIGIEYGFENVPIQLSLDIRPEIYFNSSAFRSNTFGSDLALSIRYQF